MKTKTILLICATLLLITCREFKDNPLPRDITVNIETSLTEGVFVNNEYSISYIVKQVNRVSNFPVTATYTVSRKAVITSGAKEYSDRDTLMFEMKKPRKITIKPTETGTYRLTMTFRDDKGTVIGTDELNFSVGAPDLDIYFVMNGSRVQNLNQTPNFQEYEGLFIVRVTSATEELNKGRLKLTANITGASVEVKNWKDNEAKISQANDLPQTVDFIVEYKNISIGETEFKFTAESQNSKASVSSSMTVQESKPGTLTLNTTYNQQGNFYSRPLLWVGQTDEVSYLIQPDPQAVSNVYRMRFEMKDPMKLVLFNTGDPAQHFAENMYEPNRWYDFSNKLSGSIFYVFPLETSSYKDTIFISLQNGEMGAINRYKLFVSCRQSDDFDFNVTFRPTLIDGYDEIKLSELRDNNINDFVKLSVLDENPYSKFDYQLSWQNMNSFQSSIRQTLPKANYSGQFDLSYVVWLGNEFGYLVNSNPASGSVELKKNLQLICRQVPTEDNAGGYLGTFNWVYEVRRESDGKRKTVTRQIRVVDDRMASKIEFADENKANREWTYQNETVTMYQLFFSTPSIFSTDYELTVLSTNVNVADVYLMNPNGTFRLATFGNAEVPPSSHNGATAISANNAGRIQIKGKQPGTATLTFALKHKPSGATKSITKTVTTTADPVQFIIEPAPTIDNMNVERGAVSFGGTFHPRQNPRFKIRLHKSSLFSGNTTGTADVVFTTTPSLTNVARLTIRGGSYSNTSVAYGSTVQLAYDTDYFVTVASPTAHPWNVPIGSEQFVNITLTKATNQQTTIVHNENNTVRYTLRAYQSPLFTLTGDSYNEAVCNYEEEEYSRSTFEVYSAGVIISRYPPNKITISSCNNSFKANNAAFTNVTWHDGNELDVINLYLATGYYYRSKFSGDYISAIPGYTPSNPNWQNQGPCITITDYYITVTVQDNWGYTSQTQMQIPQKIIYGC